jgi:ABC-2 type transport system ATP-binding protein
MSISVSGVTKHYGQQRALDDVSFEISAGEVVGFLGPNGAGKSTMMKILTCFLPATAGEAVVAGHNVATDGLAVRRSVGYLPEHNPLYTDLYVRESLEFVAGLYGLRNARVRAKEMIGLVGLGREQHKKIGALSKGYRQRVGLAHALIHDPQVLILDEPTSGLDPNQLEEVRALIAQLGKEKTVMLSTHIMQEVEAICGRVLIMDRGRLVADDTTNALRGGAHQREALEVEFDGVVNENALRTISGVLAAVRTERNTWVLFHAVGTDVRAAVFQKAVDKGWKVLTLQRAERGLEQVFKELTKG